MANSSSQQDTLISCQKIKSLIDDDDYKVIKSIFLMKGKGRRPSIPHFQDVTNKLLIQLYFLRDEAHASFAELKTWMEKLVPITSSVSESRFVKKLKTVMKECKTLTGEQRLAFLGNIHDFNALPMPLASLRLSRLHLMDIHPYTETPVEDIEHGVVVCLVHFRVHEHKPANFVPNWVKKLSISTVNFSDKQLDAKITEIMKEYTRLTKYNMIEERNDFMKHFFLGGIDSEECSKNSLIAELKNKLAEKEKFLLKSNNRLSDSKSIIKDLRLELECQGKIIKDLQREKITLLSENKALEQTFSEFKRQVKIDISGKEKLIKDLEHAKTKMNGLRKENNNKKRQLDLMSGNNENLRNDVDARDKNCSEMKAVVGSLNKKVKSEQSMKSKYKCQYQQQRDINSDLSDMLTIDADQTELREAGSSHRYSDTVRRTYYALQGEANVASTNCSKVVSTVARHLFNATIQEEELPKASTALNFSNEAHIIAKEQIIDEIKNADHFIYASDGTSRDKAHYLEQHVHLSNGKTLSLGFSAMATQDSDTLLERCVKIFKDMCQLHCSDNECNETELLKEIIRKMKGLLSDRAAVCKAFDAKMAKYKTDLFDGEESSIHFLFCNAHFLIALSTAAERGINEFEEACIENGGKLGRDAKTAFCNWSKGESAATRLVRTAAEVVGPRCDEKNGCRQEWLAFCSTHDIASSFTSYRNNRFNNLFQNASAILRHRQDLQIFFEKYVSHNNMKLQSIIADLQDSRVIGIIAVLAFFNFYFTEPYWKLMNSSKKYSEFHTYVKKMRDCLLFYSSSDFDASSASSIFDDFPCKREDYSVMKDFLKSDLYCNNSFQKCLSIIVTKVQAALHRQLSDFLEEGVFGGVLDQCITAILSTCPLTNLTGERLFGDLDYCIKKRRNTSLHTRSTSNMWKHNKTAKWLAKKSECATQKIVEKAIKCGPEWRKRHRDDMNAVRESVEMKIVENKDRNDEKETKQQERVLAAIDSVLGYNGQVVTNKEELDDLYSGPKAFERLKDQIRFRRLVWGESISLVGNKKVIYERLLHHITTATTSPTPTATT